MSVMRSLLLAASQNGWLRERASRYKFVRRSVSRFMPGEEIEDALAAAKALETKKISGKLTQLGLDQSVDLCFAYLKKILEQEDSAKTVWVDMEASPYVDATLEV